MPLCQLLGLTYRQIDYWTRTGLVTPSIMDSLGSGQARLYSEADAFRLYVIHRVVSAGASLQRVRCMLEWFDQENMDWNDVTLVVEPWGVWLCRTPGDLHKFLVHATNPTLLSGPKLRDDFDVLMSRAKAS